MLSPDEFIKDMQAVTPAKGTEDQENERQATFEKANPKSDVLIGRLQFQVCRNILSVCFFLS